MAATSPKRLRMRRFVFTLNGREEQLEKDFESLKKFQPTWLIVARETCPMTQRKHLQGACVLGTQLAFATIKKIPGFERAHIEFMKGTPAQSLVYCTKEDKVPYQYGVMPCPGKRNDLHTAIDMLKTGITIQEMIRTAETPVVATFAKYPRGLAAISQAFRTDSDREHKPCVIWLHGATGTGKTRSVFEFARLSRGVSDLWVSNGSLQWFDGYDGQRITLLDDYRTDHAKFAFVLRLLDRYPLRVPFKGGHVEWQPQVIFITAPQSPRIMWNLRTEEALQQLDRRIQCNIDVDEFPSYPELFAHILESVIELSTRDPDYKHLGSLLRPAGSEKDSGVSSDDITPAQVSEELIISSDEFQGDFSEGSGSCEAMSRSDATTSCADTLSFHGETSSEGVL